MFMKCNLLFAGKDVTILSGSDLDQMIGRVNREDFQVEKTIHVISDVSIGSYKSFKTFLRQTRVHIEHKQESILKKRGRDLIDQKVEFNIELSAIDKADEGGVKKQKREPMN
jgi:hypothetical protein